MVGLAAPFVPCKFLHSKSFGEGVTLCWSNWFIQRENQDRRLFWNKAPAGSQALTFSQKMGASAVFLNGDISGMVLRFLSKDILGHKGGKSF